MTNEESLRELSEFLESLEGLEGLAASDISSLKDVARGELEREPPQGISAEAHAEVGLKGAVPEGSESDVRSKIANMSIPEKIQLALFGNGLCRAILILDSSRIVQNCVLRSPRLIEGEVEAFAQNPNVSELVLREISKNRSWMKSYSIKHKLVTNPKTPGDLALKWLHFLVKSDLRKIAMSRNLPQLVVVNARKLAANLEKKK